MTSTYQRSHTATGAILIDNPKLRMYLERINDSINIYGAAVLKLFQDPDLVQGDLNALILCQRIGLVVSGVDIDDFEGNDTIVDLIKAENIKDLR